MLALKIIGVILGILILILSLSVTLYVSLEEELSIRWGIGGLRFWLLRPGEEEDSDTDPPEEEGKSREKTSKKDEEPVRKKPTEEAPSSAAEEKPPAETTPLAQPAEAKAEDTPKKRFQKKIRRGQESKEPKSKRDFKETVYLILDAVKAVLPPLGFLMKHLRITALKIEMSVGGEDAAEAALHYAAVGSGVYSAVAVLKTWITVKVRKIELYADFVTGETRQHITFKVKLRLALILFALCCMIVRFVGNTIRKKSAASNAADSEIQDREASRINNKTSEKDGENNE